MVGRVVVTMGDPAGIGPEIILKSAKLGAIDFTRTVILGDFNVLSFYNELYSLGVVLNRIEDLDELRSDSINILSLTELEVGKDFDVGRTNQHCGEACMKYIETAVDLIMRGYFGALVTAPISKKALHLAGYNWPGHTELIAKLSRTRRFAMMLTVENLRVVLVTTHIALRDVPNSISEDGIVEKAILLHDFLKKHMKMEKPKIGILALNPHAGEGGAFGEEEMRIIKPAVSKLRNMGILAEGPIPSDVAFYMHRIGKIDGVVAMYHDQGLIPVKFYGFDRGVNVTLGLPFIRTSPDHGTAFDIAGQNTANPRSFIEAYKLALSLLD
ncbi:MAG: 4-hydroxythreonine-4-phosphate dehydrogenase PdxA [Thermosulfidibacteraceae bacterium]|jgi:4-hydroxythreonine-4-phosphate dehydrogenase